MMDPLWSETCCSTFKYSIILIVFTYYILFISCVIKCLITNYSATADTTHVDVHVALIGKERKKHTFLR